MNEKLSRVSLLLITKQMRYYCIHINETIRLKFLKRKWKETKTLEENEVENNDND